VLQVRKPVCVCHAPVRACDTHPVRPGRLQFGKVRGDRRPADPWPQHLTHRTEAQSLAPLQKIDDGAVVPVISH
jgi:hypothetical protein